MSQGYTDNLKKVGNFWHYRFSVLGKTFRGSTKCKSRAEALKFVQGLMTSKVMEWKLRSFPYVFHVHRSVESTLQYLKVPTTKGSGPDPTNRSVILARTRHGAQRTFDEATLTRSNLKAFLDALDSLNGIPAQVVLAIRTMLFMGLRAHEVREMRWEHFDPALGTYTLCPTKSHHVHRMPVPTELSHRFREWKGSSQAFWVAQGKPMPALVFWGPEGRQHSLVRLLYWIRAAATSIGIHPPSSSHWLRKSCAALLAESGISCFIIRKFMRVHNSTWDTAPWSNEKLIAESVRRNVDALFPCSDELADG